MISIKTKNDWWQVFEAYKTELRELVKSFHPSRRNEGLAASMPVSASVTEADCEEVRQMIKMNVEGDPLAQFDEAALAANMDHTTLTALLNETWFGIPESYAARELPGFFVLCDLCSESWVFEETD